MEKIYSRNQIALYKGDSRDEYPLEPNSIDHCITSPPYFNQIDYEVNGQIGLEGTIELYLDELSKVFRNVYRALKNGGTASIIIADTINNHSPVRTHAQRRKSGQWTFRRKLMKTYLEKEPLNIPFLLHDRLREDGWIGRPMAIWNKISANGVPNGDGPAQTHEYILRVVKWHNKSRSYAACTATNQSVYTHAPAKNSQHPCVYPPGLVRDLLRPCQGEVIIDPFAGSGTTLEVAQDMGWRAIGIELSEKYCQQMIDRWNGLYVSAGQKLHQPTLFDLDFSASGIAESEKVVV